MVVQFFISHIEGLALGATLPLLFPEGHGSLVCTSVTHSRAGGDGLALSSPPSIYRETSDTSLEQGSEQQDTDSQNHCFHDRKATWKQALPERARPLRSFLPRRSCRPAHTAAPAAGVTVEGQPAVRGRAEHSHNRQKHQRAGSTCVRVQRQKMQGVVKSLSRQRPAVSWAVPWAHTPHRYAQCLNLRLLLCAWGSSASERLPLLLPV